MKTDRREYYKNYYQTKGKIIQSRYSKTENRKINQRRYYLKNKYKISEKNKKRYEKIKSDKFLEYLKINAKKHYYKNRSELLNKVNTFRAINRENATNHNEIYTDQEERLILNCKGSIINLAKQLGRSVCAIITKRTKLRKITKAIKIKKM